MLRNLLFRSTILFALALIMCLITPQAALALPTGFLKTTVAQGLSLPTSMVQAPDGSIFVGEKNGAVKLVKNNQVTATILTLPVKTEGEEGIAGMTVDPSFASNHYLYITYVNTSPFELRISRFVVNGNTAGSETILLRQAETNSIHFSGTLKFGADGKLWASIGDNSIYTNAQKLDTLQGKIIRINKDGTIPSDNPFVGQTGKKGEIWAYGFRNPFRFNFIGSKPIVGDVGQDTVEEINIVEKGGNYGWPLAEGPCNNCSFINPLFSYNHNGQSASVTGGFVYTSSAQTAFPAEYQGSYFYGDYARGFIRRITFDQNGFFVNDGDFDPTSGNVVDFFQGADGALYYLNIYTPPNYDTGGTIQKISYQPQNLPPTAKMTATPTAGKKPLTVAFSSNGSSDPENKPLTYTWDFGDGKTSVEQNPTHKYSKAGKFTAKLTVSDGSKTSDPVTTVITVGNEPPKPTIDEPIANSKYNAGQEIHYAGSATDPETGDLPASSFSWTMIFHHSTHVHPFLGPITGVKQGTFTIPDTGEPSADTWYELKLTVTDADGLQTSTSTFIYPNKIILTLATQPPGLSLSVDGINQITPATISAVVGFKRTIDAPSPQQVGADAYVFSSWSDNGVKTHQITTPNKDTTYTALLKKSGDGTGKIYFRIREFDKNNVFTGNFLNTATAKLIDAKSNAVVQTQSSTSISGQDGWVHFDNVNVGTYTVLSYKSGLDGVWKQTDCGSGGTITDATVKNDQTENLIAVAQTSVPSIANQITYCHDAGLKNATITSEQKGKLYFRIREFNPDGSTTKNFINGATAKLIDTNSNAVVQTQSSASISGQDGWVHFDNVTPGTYNVLGYKKDITGLWKQTDCNGQGTTTDATIKNSLTEDTVAVLQNSINIVAGGITYCRDMGLTSATQQGPTGTILFRVHLVNNTGIILDDINGAIAKLTDATGTTLYKTATSDVLNGQNGWVRFTSVTPGTYSIATYKNGLTGLWKQTDCNGQGTTTDATIKNSLTENLTAVFQKDVVVTENQITYCRDAGLMGQ